MQINAKLRSVSQTETKSEKFSLRKFTVETAGKYPQTLEFQLVNTGVVLIDPFKLGDEICIDFEINGREHNGKVFNSLKAWKIQLVSSGSRIDASPQASESSEPKSADDDLPF